MKMQLRLEPGADGVDAGNGEHRRLLRSVDHYYRQPELPRRRNLGVGSLPAGVLGNEGLDAPCLHQRHLGIQFVRPALKDDLGVMGQVSRIRSFDHSRYICVLWRAAERRHLLAPDRQQHACGLGTERLRGCRSAVDAKPRVSVMLLPRGAGRRDHWDSRQPCGLDGIGRDAHGEGMRRVYDRIDAVLGKPVCQTGHAAESADPALRSWRTLECGAAGQRQRHMKALVVRELPHQSRSFRRAAEDENAHVRF